MTRIRSGGTVAAAAPPATGDWTRPADWLTLPTVTAGQQTMVGLVAVWPGDSNWVSLTVAGAYTVDWGDGSAAQNVATGVRADHNILWASVSSATLTTLGYRQAVVTVTMQSANNLTSLNLNVDTANTAFASSLWLDITMASVNLTVLTVSGSSPAPASLLQRFEYVGASAITSTAPTFNSARGLRKVVGTEWTATCTSFSSIFASCSALTTIPLLDTSALTNMAFAFQACSALTTIPLLDTSLVTSLYYAFHSCSALTTIPLLDTSAVTNFSNTFELCQSLSVLPALNTGAATTHAAMLSGCYSLRVGAMSGTKQTIDYSGCALSATELDAIYTGLATVTAKTITVSTNWGTASDTPTIGTSKGWTVTG